MPAVSKAQQRFFGMVRATQKGEMKNPSSEILNVADDISVKDAKKMAKTKHKGLPEKKGVKEEVNTGGNFSYKDFIASAEAAKKRQKEKVENRKKKSDAYIDRIRKGIKFYDSKGSGRLVKGKKVYDK